MGSSKRKRKPIDAYSCPSNHVHPPPVCYEGEGLARLLKSILRELQSARQADTALPYRIWIKQQFSIGVNDVTRILQRMPQISVNRSSNSSSPPVTRSCEPSKAIAAAPHVQLQAILVASDCSPRWLTRHVPSMASSRKVPLIFVKHDKGGSLRLGELVKLKTAIAIGVKVKGNTINRLIEEILHGNEINLG
ncbi:uncharacterized protein LOC127796554 [Diospyros lotus]|uniref:uncharacterized protein LOC127796554 n=1 Tax=Diospyros lotus TaxID=55363 RepID=UPI00224D0098|nr:uncharacterized protein LOC127796554 [Diospyros lotus]